MARAAAEVADNTGYVLAMEAIAEACASVAVILASSNLVACILADHATSEQRARWLQPFARGELGPAGHRRGGVRRGRALRHTLRAAALLDRGQHAPLETSMAKLAASEACGRVVDARAASIPGLLPECNAR